MQGLDRSDQGRRIQGTVSRWGTRGYGFISSSELPRDAWSHVNLIVDPGIDTSKPLPRGTVLEFEAREEGGRIQAVAVTRPGVRPPTQRSEPVRGAIRGLEHLRGLTVPSEAAKKSPSVPPEPPPPDVPVDASLATRVAAEKRRIEAERGRLDSDAQRLLRRADAAASQIPEVERDFATRMSELTAERDKQLADLRREADAFRRQGEALVAKRDSLPVVTRATLQLVEDHLRRARQGLSQWIEQRSVVGRELSAARQAAVATIGEEAVREYDEIRRRRAASTDPVEVKAYTLAERAARESVRAYADALERSGANQTATVSTLVLAADDPEGRLILVTPITPADVDAEDDLRWRIASFVFDAAERAAREMDATVTRGVAAGCLAVELRPWGAEPELVEIAIQDAWDARPSLARGSLSLIRDLVPSMDAGFLADEDDAADDDEPPKAPSEDAAGGDLRTVSRRLGMTLDDLVASLYGSGLPFPDDRIESGVEESLRKLLGMDLGTRSRPKLPEPKLAAVPQVSEPARSSPPAIAKRLLAKLLRDGRIGGRHTAAANVWGHHFADDEKDVAREVTEQLVRRGILIAKRKPGGEHLSIDPRRIDEVQKIVLGSADPSLFA